MLCRSIFIHIKIHISIYIPTHTWICVFVLYMYIHNTFTNIYKHFYTLCKSIFHFFLKIKLLSQILYLSISGSLFLLFAWTRAITTQGRLAILCRCCRRRKKARWSWLFVPPGAGSVTPEWRCVRDSLPPRCQDPKSLEPPPKQRAVAFVDGPFCRAGVVILFGHSLTA